MSDDRPMTLKDEERKLRKRERDRAWRHANREKVREANRRWRAKPETRAMQTKYRLTWSKKYPDRARAIRQRYTVKNKEKIRQLARRTALRNKFGLSLADYQNMFAAQDYRCAICHSPHPRWENDWHVDHCHASGKVRGILCQWCNRILPTGMTPEILRRAALYLEGTLC